MRKRRHASDAVVSRGGSAEHSCRAEHPSRAPLGELDLPKGGPPLARSVPPHSPAEELHTATYMERIFEPADDGSSQRNVYHFEDERGTVSGRMCGPWSMSQEMPGRRHGAPFAPTHTTLLLTGGPCAWTNKTAKRRTVRCSFLQRRAASNLRMSASLDLLRERACWRPLCCSGRTTVRGGLAPGGAPALTRVVRPRSCVRPGALRGPGRGQRDECDARAGVAAGRPVRRVPCRRSASDEDVILLCADDTVAIIAPKHSRCTLQRRHVGGRSRRASRQCPGASGRRVHDRAALARSGGPPSHPCDTNALRGALMRSTSK